MTTANIHTQNSGEKGRKASALQQLTSVMRLHLNDKETKGFLKASTKNTKLHPTAQKSPQHQNAKSLQISTQLLTGPAPLFP